MKKFTIALLALATALAIAPAALAGTLCPNQAAQGGYTNTFTNVSGPLDGSSCGSSDTAVNMSIANVTADYAKLTWTPTNSGYPAGLTLGDLGGITASVSNVGPSQPFYMFAFTDPNDSFLNTTSGDQILLIEFQPSTISGNSMGVNPNATLFNLYDNTLGKYLESGQADAQTLAEWIALDPSLSSDALQEIRIGIGMAGGGTYPESLTVYSADVSETPEPSSLLLLGTGLLGLAFVAFRKAKPSGLVLHS